MKSKRRIFVCLTVYLLLFSSVLLAQDEYIDFESGAWSIENAEVREHLGRSALAGFAVLNDADFENGVIEVDIAVTGARSYPGLYFRMQDPGNAERFYVRPHREGLYGDDLQYMPIHNGIESWQLFTGEGYSAGYDVPDNEWVHYRLEVSGKQLRVFKNDEPEPALVVNDMKHGASRGGIALLCPRDGSAWFSNFRYHADETLQFGPPPDLITPIGTIINWELSQTIPMSQLDIEEHPDDQEGLQLDWRKVAAEPSGIVNVARFTGKVSRGADCIYARTTLHSDSDRVREYRFGYSDLICVFLNGRPLFNANSAYRQRDPSFLGAIGVNDALWLPLKKGENELLFMVGEVFGGWGFICQDADTLFTAPGVEDAWETARSFRTPESVVFDRKRNAVYVTNYSVFEQGGSGGQSISRLALDGTVLDAEWIGGLTNPTGMVLYRDRLFVVERPGLVEIDPAAGAIVNRIPIPDAGFLNDVTADKKGVLFVSDSEKNTILRIQHGVVEEWLSGGDVGDPNGLCIDEGKLIVGNNADHRLKAFDLGTKKMEILADPGPGIIDGLKIDKRGNVLVSHFDGKLFRVSPGGDVTTLIDATVIGTRFADFEYISDEKSVLIPTFYGDRVVKYKLGE